MFYERYVTNLQFRTFKIAALIIIVFYNPFLNSPNLKIELWNNIDNSHFIPYHRDGIIKIETWVEYRYASLYLHWEICRSVKMSCITWYVYLLHTHFIKIQKYCTFSRFFFLLLKKQMKCNCNSISRQRNI